jgi:hypothetical protein
MVEEGPTLVAKLVSLLVHLLQVRGTTDAGSILSGRNAEINAPASLPMCAGCNCES